MINKILKPIKNTFRSTEKTVRNQISQMIRYVKESANNMQMKHKRESEIETLEVQIQ